MTSAVVNGGQPEPLSKNEIKSCASGPDCTWEQRVENIGKIQALELSKLEYMFTLKFPDGKSTVTKNVAMSLDEYFKTNTGMLKYTLISDISDTNKTINVTLFPLVEAA
ncbi:MAG: hypothetical protein KAS32_29245 [Candidatus Peribacteraceae bacterium]|nr:hypothetical protein [Candidatus Peribacteraceae bacterium]